jgi:hypothetical protein
MAECPWNEPSVYRWKQYLDQQGATTQQSAELLAQMVARQKRAFARIQAAQQLVACLSLYSDNKSACCNKCNIPCVVDGLAEALFLPECGHLVHTMCQSQETKCPACGVKCQRVECPEAAQDAWLDTKILYDLVNADTDKGVAAVWAETKATFGGQITDGLPIVQTLITTDQPPTTETLATMYTSFLQGLAARAKPLIVSLTTVVAQPLVQNEVVFGNDGRSAPIVRPVSTDNFSGGLSTLQDKWQPDALKVKGTIVTQRGTELMVITTQYNGKCGQCKKPTTEKISLICKPKASDDKRWFCTTCAAGRDEEDVRKELLSTGDHGSESSKKRAAPNDFFSRGPSKRCATAPSSYTDDLSDIINM